MLGNDDPLCSTLLYTPAQGSALPARLRARARDELDDSVMLRHKLMNKGQRLLRRLLAAPRYSEIPVSTSYRNASSSDAAEQLRASRVAQVSLNARIPPMKPQSEGCDACRRVDGYLAAYPDSEMKACRTDVRAHSEQYRSHQLAAATSPGHHGVGS